MFQIKWLWTNLKGFQGRFIGAVILTISCNIMLLIAPIFSQMVVDNFITGENASYNLANNRPMLFALLISIILFTLLRTSLTFKANMDYERCSQGMLYKVRSHLFRCILNQDMDYYNKNRTGDLMTRLTGDLDMVRHMVSWVVKGLLESSISYLAAMVYFFYVDWLLALCLFIFTPVILFISGKFKKSVGPMYINLREKLAQMNTAAQENISGNRVVKAFANEQYEIDKFNEKSNDFAKANKKASLKWLKYFPFMEGISQGLAVVLILVGGLFLIFERLTMGEYIAFSSLLWTVSNPMKSLGAYINDFQRYMASSTKVIEIYYGRSSINDRDDAISTTERIKGEIEFKNVSYRYKKNDVLRNISFHINPGETVAIMGETGSGKTTLINLIPRFYDIKSGEILIDGVNVKHRKIKELRKNISMATQDVLLYSDTIDGNISFGDSDMSEEDVHQNAYLAAASEFIEKMPEGYNTIVGERGVGLSGGQKQRISLARALAVKPAILILDDTTSAVDMETETHIQNSLKNLDFPCTKIIIAQRISSTKDADKIIILNNGEITECGTHEELIQNKDGYYYSVYKLQIEGISEEV